MLGGGQGCEVLVGCGVVTGQPKGWVGNLAMPGFQPTRLAAPVTTLQPTKSPQPWPPPLPFVVGSGVVTGAAGGVG